VIIRQTTGVPGSNGVPAQQHAPVSEAEIDSISATTEETLLSKNAAIQVIGDNGPHGELALSLVLVALNNAPDSTNVLMKCRLRTRTAEAWATGVIGMLGLLAP